MPIISGVPSNLLLLAAGIGNKFILLHSLAPCEGHTPLVQLNGYHSTVDTTLTRSLNGELIRVDTIMNTL